MYDEIDRGAYKPKMDFPRPPKRVCECGHSFGTYIPNFCSLCGKPVKEVYEKKHVEYRQERLKYQAEEARLLDEFWSDAFDYCGISEDHPKADVLREIVWERGHSDGLYAVLEELEDLSRLID